MLDDFAATFDAGFDIAIEELHDHSVTFVIEFDAAEDAYFDFFERSTQVQHLEQLNETTYLVTKTSCGAYDAIDRNHGILRRRNHISEARRVYTILFFRREDLRAIITEFKQIGKVTLGKVTHFNEPSARLTERQYEAVSAALEHGYFKWPREMKSEDLAAELGISRATFLEHLRKAQAKLLADAMEGTEHPARGNAPESKAH
ncbi:helix-turn-helix domain-containing protein [Haladaptatus sp. GCM10025707]|uniref:helix-turn-helix domain-containing protein n=1 Tax=Haladaptatus sp. GCM10025707 TaxID=3252658 RepID=UPI0036146688